VGDEDVSDDEPLMTKFVNSQNMKGQKVKTIEACNEPVKKSEAAGHVSDNDDIRLGLW
jgi:hypothetical protein